MKLNMTVLLVVILASCKNSPHSDERQVMMDKVVVANAPSESTPVAETSLRSAEQKLIKNGSLSFETDDIEKTRKEIEKLYHEFNGYLTSERHFNYGERLQHEQEIRVLLRKILRHLFKN